jgi:hypothetical protein
MWLLQLDREGRIMQQSRFGGAGYLAANAFRSVPAGYIVAGEWDRFRQGTSDAFALALDGSGTIPNCIFASSRPLATVVGQATAIASTATAIATSAPTHTSNATPRDSNAASAQQCGEPYTTTAVEYYHRTFDHYFVTTLPEEIAALDAGVPPNWSRTGLWFGVRVLGAPGSANVCRFWSGQAFAPKSSHFYSPYAAECEDVRTKPEWRYEGEVFGLDLANAAGGCGAGLAPLYRLYNANMGGAPNHRYTTSEALRRDMIGRGWIPEGVGIGVVGCAPVQ